MKSNNLKESGVPTVHRGHAAGSNAIEKAASQLVSDTKYKVNKELGPNTNLNPAQVAQKYLQKLSSSSAPQSVKALARKKLMGEEHILSVKQSAQDSIIEVLGKVFVNESDKKKVWIVVTDKKTGNRYRRPLDPETANSKIAELRSNPNIQSVERTHYTGGGVGDPQGQKTAKVKAGKGLDPVGKEDSDVNNNGIENDKSDKYLLKRRAAVRNAIASRATQKEEFIGEVKKPQKNKTVTGKGVNNYEDGVVKVFPTVREETLTDPRMERKQLSILQRFQDMERKLNQQKFAAQRAGRIPVGSVQMDSYELEGQSLSEKSLSVNQQQAAGAALAAKRGEIDPSELKGSSLQMYKSMTEKQLLDFAKTKHKGLPEKVDESNCGCEDEKESKLKTNKNEENPRSKYAQDAKIKNTLRSMGLKMSYEPEGEMVDEAQALGKTRSTDVNPKGAAVRVSSGRGMTMTPARGLGASKPEGDDAARAARQKAQAKADRVAAARDRATSSEDRLGRLIRSVQNSHYKPEGEMTEAWYSGKRQYRTTTSGNRVRWDEDDATDDAVNTMLQRGRQQQQASAGRERLKAKGAVPKKDGKPVFEHKNTK